MANLLSTSVTGTVNSTGNMTAAGFTGNANVGGTGAATWHPSGIYVGSTQWLYGTQYRNNSSTSGQGQLYFDGNYGYGMVGLYDSTRYQAVFAMGDSYKLPVDGSGTGSLYGIAWTHTNVGGQSKAGLGHQALFMMDGRTYTAIGAGIWTDGTITTTSHGTSANWNTAYGWGNHASAGYLTSLPSHNHDDRYYTETEINNFSYFRDNEDRTLKILRFTGVGGDSGNSSNHSYAIYQGGGSWSHPYPDLHIGYHTGIKIGANTGYGGTRFYDDSTMVTELFSVGNGDSHVRAANNLYAGALYDAGSRVAISRSEGRDYINYSRYVYNNGAYSGSGWIEPSDLGVRYANSAGSVAWGNVSSRPTALSQFSNDLGNYGGWITGVTNISGYSGSVTIPDWRNTSYTPAQYDGNRVNWHFNNTDHNDGPPGDFWGAMQTVSPWSEFNTSHRQSQLWWGGSVGLSYRYAVGSGYTPTGWSAWEKIITSGSIGSQSVSYATTAGNSNSISNAVGNTHTWTGANYFRSNLGATSGALSAPPLQVYCTGGNSAFMSFHRSGNYAVNFGLDSDNVLRMGGWSATANRWQLDMSGNMTVAGDVTAFSDARVKTNVQTIENALDKTLALRGVSYNRTDSDDTRTKIGVIAQETLEVVPEVVNQDNSGMYNVSYGNMTALLIEAIKEQQAQIEDLKLEVKKLRGE